MVDTTDIGPASGQDPRASAKPTNRGTGAGDPDTAPPSSSVPGATGPIADALQAVRDGRLDATVFQDAQGQGNTAVETAVKILRKQPYEKQSFIPFQLVTRENVGQYLK